MNHNQIKETVNDLCKSAMICTYKMGVDNYRIIGKIKNEKGVVVG